MTNVRHILKVALGFAIIAGTLASPARASDAEEVAKLQERITALQDEISSLKLRCWWLERLRGYEKRLTSSVTAEIQLGGRAPKTGERLRGIRLPEAPSEDKVREYIARVIVAAQDRDVFGPDDPEIAMLEMVGPKNVHVLIEPLLYLRMFGGASYVVAAVKGLVGDEHKHFILKFLPFSQDLVEVVTARGWTRDAAPILLKRLAERSPYLNQDWIDASARVAGPENYEDLKFQLAHGQNPWWIWLAIRELPGMEPLDDFVAGEWRATPRMVESWEGRSFAAVAAHYGQLDALGVLAKNVKDKYDWQQPFRALTGYKGPIEDAASWWERNKADLTFDRDKRVYVRSSPAGK